MGSSLAFRCLLEGDWIQLTCAEAQRNHLGGNADQLGTHSESRGYKPHLDVCIVLTMLVIAGGSASNTVDLISWERTDLWAPFLLHYARALKAMVKRCLFWQVEKTNQMPQLCATLLRHAFALHVMLFVQ